MSLREKLLKYQAKDLIEVAEPHSDYTHEAKTGKKNKSSLEWIQPNIG